MIKVKATEEGYFDHKRVFEGSVFEIESEEQFSARWMERASKKKAAKRSVSKSQFEEPDLSADEFNANETVI